MRETVHLSDTDRLFSGEFGDRRVELLEGVLIESERMTMQEYRVCVRLISRLLGEKSIAAAGYVAGCYGGAFLLSADPPTVLIPDVAVFPEALLHGDGASALKGAPLLAVEVVSPSNTRRELLKKTGAYLAGGAAAVWIVDPQKETVLVETEGSPLLLSRDGVAELPAPLGTVKFPVSAIFA